MAFLSASRTAAQVQIHSWRQPGVGLSPPGRMETEMRGDVASVCARVTRTQQQNLLLGESECRQAGGSEREKVVGSAHRGPEELLKPGRQEGRGGGQTGMSGTLVTEIPIEKLCPQNGCQRGGMPA